MQRQKIKDSFDSLARFMYAQPNGQLFNRSDGLRLTNAKRIPAFICFYGDNMWFFAGGSYVGASVARCVFAGFLLLLISSLLLLLPL